MRISGENRALLVCRLFLSISLSLYTPSLPRCNFVIKRPSVNEGKPRRCFAEFSAHRELIPRLGFQSARNERIPRGKRSRKSGHYLRGDVALLLAAEQRNNESRRTNILRGAASPPSPSLSLSLSPSLPLPLSLFLSLPFSTRGRSAMTPHCHANNVCMAVIDHHAFSPKALLKRPPLSAFPRQRSRFYIPIETGFVL